MKAENTFELSFQIRELYLKGELIKVISAAEERPSLCPLLAKVLPTEHFEIFHPDEKGQRVIQISKPCSDSNGLEYAQQ